MSTEIEISLSVQEIRSLERSLEHDIKPEEQEISSLKHEIISLDETNRRRCKLFSKRDQLKRARNQLNRTRDQPNKRPA